MVAHATAPSLSTPSSPVNDTNPRTRAGTPNSAARINRAATPTSKVRALGSATATPANRAAVASSVPLTTLPQSFTASSHDYDCWLLPEPAAPPVSRLRVVSTALACR